jgi:hypothetical protein
MGVSEAEISYSNSTLNIESENTNNGYDSSGHVYDTTAYYSKFIIDELIYVLFVIKISIKYI